MRIHLIATLVLGVFATTAQAASSASTTDNVMSGAIRGGIIGAVVGGIAGVVMWALKKNKK